MEVWQCNWSRVGAVLCYTEDEFRDAVEDKAAAIAIKVIELFGEVGGDLLQVQVLCVIHVIYKHREEGWNSLLSFGHITNQHAVYTNLYTYGSTTHKPRTKFSMRCQKTRI